MALTEIIDSLSKRIGATLGPTVMVLSFGVMFGSLLSDTVAAQRVSSGLIKFFGEKRAN